MGKASIKENKNIYQITREKLGLSRAAAVKNIPGNPEFPGMDGIAEYRLVKIEDGTVTVQPADVVAMAKRYNEPVNSIATTDISFLPTLPDNFAMKVINTKLIGRPAALAVDKAPMFLK